jgi:hypothetical protein
MTKFVIFKCLNKYIEKNLFYKGKNYDENDRPYWNWSKKL